MRSNGSHSTARWLAVSSASLLVLVACSNGGTKKAQVTSTSGQASTSAPERTTAVQSTTSAVSKLSATSRLRFDGVGPVRLGMTIEEAKVAAGTPLKLTTGPHCRSLEPEGEPAGLRLVVTEGDRLDVIEVAQGPVLTQSGVGVGSTEDQVRQTYPGIEVRGTDAASHRLVLRSSDGRYSLVFSIANGRVVAFRTGERAVAEADEICA